MMSGTEVDTSSAWAERTLAVLLLPFAFIVMFGGGAGLVWLWQDYRAQFWIGSCIVGVAFVALSAAASAVNRQRRRAQWLSDRSGADDGAEFDDAGLADDQSNRDLLLDVLTRVESIQQNLGVLMGEFGAEQQRVNSGRHAGPITVDIRDEFNDFDHDFDTDFDDDYDSDDDYADIDTRDHTRAADDVDGRGDRGGLGDFDVAADDRADDKADYGNDLDGDDAFLDDGPGDGAPAAGEPGEPREPGLAAQAPDSHRNPERRMRRLVRDRTGRQQWDAIPAPREPVHVIELPRDGDAGSHPDSDDEDDDEYFGEGTLLDGETVSPEDALNDQAADSGAGPQTPDANPYPAGTADNNRADDDPREGGRRRRDAR